MPINTSVVVPFVDKLDSLSWDSRISECDEWLLGSWVGFDTIRSAHDYREGIVSSAKASVARHYYGTAASRISTPTMSLSISCEGVTTYSKKDSSDSSNSISQELSIDFSTTNIYSSECPLVSKELFWRMDLSCAMSDPNLIYTYYTDPIELSGDPIAHTVANYRYIDTADALETCSIFGDVFFGAYGADYIEFYTPRSFNQMWQKANYPSYKLSIGSLAFAGYQAELLKTRPIEDSRISEGLDVMPNFPISSTLAQAELYFGIEYIAPSGEKYTTELARLDAMTVLEFKNDTWGMKSETDITSILNTVSSGLNYPPETLYAHGEHSLCIYIKYCAFSAVFFNTSDKVWPLSYVNIGSSSGSDRLFEKKKTWTVYNFWTDTEGIMMECTKCEYNGWYRKLSYRAKNTTTNVPLRIYLQEPTSKFHFDNPDTRDYLSPFGVNYFTIDLLPTSQIDFFIVTDSKIMPNSIHELTNNENGYCECYAVPIADDDYSYGVKDCTDDNFPPADVSHPYQLGIVTTKDLPLFKPTDNYSGLEYNTNSDDEIDLNRVGVQSTRSAWFGKADYFRATNNGSPNRDSVVPEVFRLYDITLTRVPLRFAISYFNPGSGAWQKRPYWATASDDGYSKTSPYIPDTLIVKDVCGLSLPHLMGHVQKRTYTGGLFSSVQQLKMKMYESISETMRVYKVNHSRPNDFSFPPYGIKHTGIYSISNYGITITTIAGVDGKSDFNTTPQPAYGVSLDNFIGLNTSVLDNTLNLWNYSGFVAPEWVIDNAGYGNLSWVGNALGFPYFTSLNQTSFEHGAEDWEGGQWFITAMTPTTPWLLNIGYEENKVIYNTGFCFEDKSYVQDSNYDGKLDLKLVDRLY